MEKHMENMEKSPKSKGFGPDFPMVFIPGPRWVIWAQHSAAWDVAVLRSNATATCYTGPRLAMLRPRWDNCQMGMGADSN